MRIPEETLSVSDDGLYLLGGKPFTGTAYRLDSTGWTFSESDYRCGMRWGVSRAWSEPGQLESERTFTWNLLWGASREWHDGGAIASDEEYELGVCVKRTRWDAGGQVIEDYRLDSETSDWAMLESQRRHFASLGETPNPESFVEPSSFVEGQ